MRRSSYSAHWRRMLAPLLKALKNEGNNTAYRPVMDTIDLLKRYLEQPLKEGAFFDPAETVPLESVVPEQWRAAVVDDKGRGGRRRHGDREVLAAIVFVATSGCTWQQLPTASFRPSGATVHRRFDVSPSGRRPGCGPSSTE